MKQEELNELINCDAYIVISENGVAINGISPKLLTLYSQLTREMQNLKGVDNKMLEKSFKMAFMEKDELLDLFKEELNKFADTLKKFTEDKKSNE